MVLMPEPLFRSVEAVPDLPRPLFLLTPGGRRFDQAVAVELAALADGPSGGFSLLCGRYEGVDQRVADHLVDGELSVGDFVLAGGELGALVVLEAVARLRPGVLGNEDSAEDESFSDGLLEYPQYTRPASFRGWEVPEVLRSGDHGAVAAWRRTQALLRTAARRPDLVERLVRASALSGDDVRALAEHGYDVPSGSRADRPAPRRPDLSSKERPSCTPPKRSTATACATTSPNSAPATPSRCTCGWSRATGSGCRSSRARSCAARAAGCRRPSPCAR